VAKQVGNGGVMKREFVKTNGIVYGRTPWSRKKCCFVRGILRVDGELQLWASCGRNLQEAQKKFDEYLTEG